MENSQYLYIFTITILIINNTLADSVINEVYKIRGQAYSAYHVSNDLLDNVNTTDQMDLRTHLASEAGKGTGKKIQSTWIYRAKEYMSQVNNRAFMNQDAAKESISQQIIVDQRTPPSEINMKKPSLPSSDAFNADLEEMNKKRVSQNSQVVKGFTKSNYPIMDALINNDYAANKKIFEEKGLGRIFSDITELADSGYSQPKITRNLIAQLAENKQALALISPELAKLARAGEAAVIERKGIADKFDKEKSVKTNFFEGAKTEYPSRLAAYEAEVEKHKAQSQKATPILSTEASKRQTHLDRQFFTKKNLHPIEGLNQLTQEERVYLLNHPDKPLNAREPKKALDIINGERKRQRNFITQVRDVSNEVSNATTENRAVRNINPSLEKETLRLSKNSKFHGNTKKYRETASARITSSKHNKGIDTFGVINENSRLALLDTMSGGSINPYEGFNSHSGIKGKNIKELLDKLPANDNQAKKALAKYVLEHGTENQVRSLKIHAGHTVIQLNHDAKFQAACKKGVSRW